MENSPRISNNKALLLYIGALFFLVFLECYFVFYQIWFEDYWGYVSIVRELSINPFQPRNPFTIGTESTIPYWPYLIIVSLLARLTAIPAQEALSLFGPINIALFLSSFYFFTRSLTKKIWFPVFALTGILIMWTGSPFFHGGFTHFPALLYMGPYPSILGLSLAMFASLVFKKNIKDPSNKKLLLFIFLFTLLLLIHQISWIFLGILSFASILSFSSQKIKDLYKLSFSLICAFSIACFWPFFPLLKFNSHPHLVSATGALIFYEDIFNRVPLLLIFLSLIFLRWIKDKSDFISISFFGCGLIYLYGYLSEGWSYGRIVSFLIFLGQLGTIELIYNQISHTKYRRLFYLLSSTCFALFLIFTAVRTYHYSRFFGLECPGTGGIQYEEIFSYVTPGDMVISDIETNLVLAGYGAKIVVFDRNSSFENDYEERKKDLDLFFNEETENKIRKEILKKYLIKYLVINKQNMPSLAFRDVLTKLGTPIFENKQFFLISTNHKE